jgi:hypothetical protein
MKDYAKFTEMLDFDPSLVTAEKRAFAFLQAQALVAQELHEVEHNVMLKENMVDVIFSQLSHNIPDQFAKSADSRKAWVQSQNEHIEAVASWAQEKANQDFLKRMYSIFNDAHLLNRQMTKDFRTGQ